jgi:hypothetical protein
LKVTSECAASRFQLVVAMMLKKVALLK